MPSVADLSQSLTAQGAPILLLDTCSIIDVASGPARIRKDSLNAAAIIINTPDSNCSLIGASLIPGEFDERLGAGEADLRKLVEDANLRSEELNHASALLGLQPQGGQFDDALANALSTLAKQAAVRLLLIDHEDRFALLAMKRAVDKVRPSRQGTFKDAQILEECLELVRLVRQLGFAGPIVFLTSNVKDFCDKDGNLHPDIQPDFALLGITFCKTWHHAKNALGV